MASLDTLEALLARGQDNPLLRFSLGSLYLKANAPAKAAAHLEHALEQDPGYSAAWKLLGQALALAGERGRAMDAYQQGIRVAEAKGDKQAAREMGVFLKRLRKGEGEPTKRPSDSQNQ